MYSIGPFAVSGVFIKALTPGFCGYMGDSDFFSEKNKPVNSSNGRKKNLRLESKCI